MWSGRLLRVQGSQNVIELEKIVGAKLAMLQAGAQGRVDWCNLKI